MRTKNAKRLWPVPATLAVVALAAFLAFGLMVTTGAQPTAAQDGADCEITVSADGATVTLPTGNACDAVGDTATIQFTGHVDADEDAIVSVLIEDKSGSITAYLVRHGMEYYHRSRRGLPIAPPVVMRPVLPRRSTVFSRSRFLRPRNIQPQARLRVKK